MVGFPPLTLLYTQVCIVSYLPLSVRLNLDSYRTCHTCHIYTYDVTLSEKWRTYIDVLGIHFQALDIPTVLGFCSSRLCPTSFSAQTSSPRMESLRLPVVEPAPISQTRLYLGSTPPKCTWRQSQARMDGHETLLRKVFLLLQVANAFAWES